MDAQDMDIASGSASRSVPNCSDDEPDMASKTSQNMDATKDSSEEHKLQLKNEEAQRAGFASVCECLATNSEYPSGAYKTDMEMVSINDNDLNANHSHPDPDAFKQLFNQAGERGEGPTPSCSSPLRCLRTAPLSTVAASDFAKDLTPIIHDSDTEESLVQNARSGHVAALATIGDNKDNISEADAANDEIVNKSASTPLDLAEPNLRAEKVKKKSFANSTCSLKTKQWNQSMESGNTMSKSAKAKEYDRNLRNRKQIPSGAGAENRFANVPAHNYQKPSLSQRVTCAASENSHSQHKTPAKNYHADCCKPCVNKSGSFTTLKNSKKYKPPAKPKKAKDLAISSKPIENGMAQTKPVAGCQTKSEPLSPQAVNDIMQDPQHLRKEVKQNESQISTEAIAEAGHPVLVPQVPVLNQSELCANLPQRENDSIILDETTLSNTAVATPEPFPKDLVGLKRKVAKSSEPFEMQQLLFVRLNDNEPICINMADPDAVDAGGDIASKLLSYSGPIFRSNFYQGLDMKRACSAQNSKKE